jgi:6-pyruvoyl-tetrahydropterin synthase
MQKEFMQQQEATEQALQKALGKISGLTHQYEREVSHRAGMELNYAQLKHQLEEQRRELQDKYANDLQTQKKEWEFERDTLLTMIQRECNTAFEKNQRRTVPIPNHSSHALQESPKGVDYDFQPSSSVDPTLRVDTGTKSDSTFWRRTSPSEANVISPMMYSEIDEVLRETEELIRSIS